MMRIMNCRCLDCKKFWTNYRQENFLTEEYERVAEGEGEKEGRARVLACKG